MEPIRLIFTSLGFRTKERRDPHPLSRASRALLVVTGLLCASQLPANLRSQGLVWFNTKVGGGGIDAPVFLGNTLEGPGPAYSAQLYRVDRGSLAPITPVTTFRPRGEGAAAIASRYVEPVEVTVPGVNSGASATLVMRAWQSSQATFEAALKNGYGYGQSAPFTIQVGGDDLPAAYLQGLQSFRIVVPEPGILVIGLVGAVFLSIQARRR